MIRRIEKLEKMVRWLYCKVKNTTAVAAGLIVGMLYRNSSEGGAITPVV